jgi:hypothetical protein
MSGEFRSHNLHCAIDLGSEVLGYGFKGYGLRVSRCFFPTAAAGFLVLQCPSVI